MGVSGSISSLLVKLDGDKKTIPILADGRTNNL